MFFFFKYLQYYFSADKKLYLHLRNILGFYPRNLNLYKQCLRHRSASVYIKDGADNSNERLEFLGDAVLGTAVAHYLFRKFPFKDEGFLTKIRSRIVSRSNLNILALKLGLNKLIESKQDKEHTYKSMLGDALEAFVGAVFLDRGYKIANDFIVHKLINIHLDLEEILITDKDFKSKMVEWSQRERKQIRYEVTNESGKGAKKLYTVTLFIDDEKSTSGKGFSKKVAEQQAAEMQCNKLLI